MTQLDAGELPDNWRTLGARDVLQAMGLEWIRSGQTAVLSIPSAVLPEERNYLLNPRHPDFVRIVIGEPRSLQTDTRLLRNLGGPA